MALLEDQIKETEAALVAAAKAEDKKNADVLADHLRDLYAQSAALEKAAEESSQSLNNYKNPIVASGIGAAAGIAANPARNAVSALVTKPKPVPEMPMSAAGAPNVPGGPGGQNWTKALTGVDVPGSQMEKQSLDTAKRMANTVGRGGEFAGGTITPGGVMLPPKIGEKPPAPQPMIPRNLAQVKQKSLGALESIVGEHRPTRPFDIVKGGAKGAIVGAAIGDIPQQIEQGNYGTAAADAGISAGTILQSLARTPKGKALASLLGLTSGGVRVKQGLDELTEPAEEKKAGGGTVGNMALQAAYNAPHLGPTTGSLGKNIAKGAYAPAMEDAASLGLALAPLNPITAALSLMAPGEAGRGSTLNEFNARKAAQEAARQRAEKKLALEQFYQEKVGANAPKLLEEYLTKKSQKRADGGPVQHYFLGGSVAPVGGIMASLAQQLANNQPAQSSGVVSNVMGAAMDNYNQSLNQPTQSSGVVGGPMEVTGQPTNPVNDVGADRTLNTMNPTSFGPGNPVATPNVGDGDYMMTTNVDAGNPMVQNNPVTNTNVGAGNPMAQNNVMPKIRQFSPQRTPFVPRRTQNGGMPTYMQNNQAYETQRQSRNPFVAFPAVNKVLPQGRVTPRRGIPVARMAEGGKPPKLEAVGYSSGRKVEGLTELLNLIKQQGGTAAAKRLERAADLVPNLEHQFQPQALKEAFTGNRSVVSVMNPTDFEKYAAPISAETKSSLSKSRRIGEPGPGQDYTHMPLGTYDDYIKYLQQFSAPGGGGFRSMPYLQLGKREGSYSFPNIQGHEGRHRTDALARQGNKSTLIGIEPRPELRELPRRSQEEYLNELAKKVGGKSPYVMPQQSEINRGLIELPEMFKKGGLVGYSGGRKVVQMLTQKLMPQAEREANKVAFLEGSKVTEPVFHMSKTGSPLVFDPKYKTELSSHGHHFGTPEQANFRQTQYDFSGNSPAMGKYHLSIKNPLEVSHMESYAPDHLAERMMDLKLLSPEKYDALSIKHNYNSVPIGNELVKVLKKNKYDGLVYRNEKEGPGLSFVPFEPTQIKSAIGNTGTFNPMYPDVTKKKGGKVKKK
jgi:hypothetical protein